MKKRFLGALPAIAFIIAVITGSISLFALPSKQWSEAERRQLALAPAVSMPNIMDGKLFDDLDMWLADHFTAREYFRHLRVLYQTGLLHENEYNGFVLEGNSIISLQKKVNKEEYNDIPVLYYASCLSLLIEEDELVGDFFKSYS